MNKIHHPFGWTIFTPSKHISSYKRYTWIKLYGHCKKWMFQEHIFLRIPKDGKFINEYFHKIFNQIIKDSGHAPLKDSRSIA